MAGKPRGTRKPWKPKPSHPIHKDAERTPSGAFIAIPWETKQKVLDRIKNGERLKDIAASMDRSTVAIRNWFKVDDEALDAYIDSKEQCLMKWCEEIITIADDMDIDPRHKAHMINTRIWSIEKFSKSIERLRENNEKNQINLNAPKGSNLIVSFAEPVKTEADIKKIEEDVIDVD